MIVNEYTGNWVNFEELGGGEIFQIDGEYFIKVKVCYKFVVEEYKNSEFAIKLDDGVLVTFLNDTAVKRCYHPLTIVNDYQEFLER